MKRHFGAFWVSLSIMALAAASSGAWAQSRLNTDRFIEGLQQRGMSELLLHFANTQNLEPSEKQRILVEQYRIQAGNTALPLNKRIEACELAMNKLKEMIANPKYAEFPRRPMWQTDLAEIVFMTYLQGLKQAATEFYEFGVPNESQTEAMTRTVSDALLQLADAQRNYTNLQGELPNRPDYKEKYEFTGVADRIEEYREKRNPYFFAIAAFYTSMLPDDAPYYQNLGNERRMPRQRTDPAQERTRLLKAGADALSIFLDDPNTAEMMRLSCKGLVGRMQLRLENPAAALAQLDPVARAGKGNYDEFLAQMGQARAYGMKGETQRAMRMTDALTRHSVAESSALYKILLTDLKHNILKAKAGDDARKIARSYAPYERLLTDQPDLGPSFIFPRWEAMIGNSANLKTMPGMMLLGVGQQAMQQGGQLIDEARKALTAKDEAKSEALAKQAEPKLDKAIRLLSALGERTSETASVRAKALWFLGVSQYFKAGPEGDKTVPKLMIALNTWIDMAEQLPKEKEATLAIQNSTALLRQYLASTEGAVKKEIMPTYLVAVKVLLKHFADNPITDDQRSFYADYLMNKGENLEAIKILRKIPQGHPTYFDAKRILVEAQYEIYKREKLEGKKPNPVILLSDLRSLRSEAEDAMKSLGPEEAYAPAIAAATCRIIQSRLAVDRNDPKSALSALDKFEVIFVDEPDLIEQALEQRIIALATLGRAKEADEAAVTMFAKFPDSAAAVIDGVLRDINDQIDELSTELDRNRIESRGRELRAKQKNLASTGARLATQILAWAKTQKDVKDLLPYELLRLKSMTIAGEADAASAALADLVAKFPSDANVIFTLAESLYYSGRALSVNDPAQKVKRDQTLRKAQIQFNMLIARIDPITYPDIIKDEPQLLPLWWRSWLRTLQCAHLRNKGTDQIPIRVGSLRQYDRSLGGTLMRRDFEKLERAYKFKK